MAGTGNEARLGPRRARLCSSLERPHGSSIATRLLASASAARLALALLAAWSCPGRGLRGRAERGGRVNRKVKIKPRPRRSPQKGEFIVGKRTQEIKNAAPELKKGGAKVATTKITAKDPITLQGNAYVTIIGRISIL